MRKSGLNNVFTKNVIYLYAYTLVILFYCRELVYYYVCVR